MATKKKVSMKNEVRNLPDDASLFLAVLAGDTKYNGLTTGSPDGLSEAIAEAEARMLDAHKDQCVCVEDSLVIYRAVAVVRLHTKPTTEVDIVGAAVSGHNSEEDEDA